MYLIQGLVRQKQLRRISACIRGRSYFICWIIKLSTEVLERSSLEIYLKDGQSSFFEKNEAKHNEFFTLKVYKDCLYETFFRLLLKLRLCFKSLLEKFSYEEILFDRIYIILILIVILSI
jgi:hypothetical protein